MPNSQFFKKSKPMSVKEIASIVECEVIGDENVMIMDIATLNNAQAGDISFLSNSIYNEAFKVTKASACIIEEKDISLNDGNMTLLVANNAYSTYALIASLLYPQERGNKGYISQKASLHVKATIGEGTTLSDFCVIEKNVKIGDNCCIGPFVYIGEGVTIGNNVIINDNVSLIYCNIGNDCIIHSGARIGQDGFGFAASKSGIVKVPQLGTVCIGDNVEIGSNTCIDRGAIEDTVIGNNSKLDNLVQIGHNVIIGENCFIAGQVGVSGSTKIGNKVMIGGQTGISGHLSIGDDVKLAGKSGVIQNVEDRSILGGFPAVNIHQWHKQTIALKRLISKESKR